MKAPQSSFKVPSECALPELVAPIARAVGAHFGVPAPTVALIALNVLGGLMSGGLRLEFHGELHPLGFHAVVLTPASPECARFEDFLLEPLVDELMRLRKLAAENSDAAQQYAELHRKISAETPASPAAIRMGQAMREIGPIAHPNVVLRGLPDEEVRDGLSSPICMLKLSDVEKEEFLHRVAATHTASPGRTLTVWAAGTFEEIISLAQTPLLRASGGRPLLALPTTGAEMFSVPQQEFEATRKAWADLVKRALALRYGPLSVVRLNPDAFSAISVAKKKADDLGTVSQTFFGASAMVSTVLRAGATLSALATGAAVPVSAESLEQALPLASWAAGFSAQFKPSRTSQARKKRLPSKPTIEGDLEKVRRVIERYPKLSDREIRRKLPSRPAGHWTLLIRSARAEFKPDFAAKFAAIAAESATAKVPR